MPLLYPLNFTLDYHDTEFRGFRFRFHYIPVVVRFATDTVGPNCTHPYYDGGGEPLVFILPFDA